MCEIEDASRVYRMNRASDSEGAASRDRNCVRIGEFHCIGGHQGDVGFFHFNCKQQFPIVVQNRKQCTKLLTYNGKVSRISLRIVDDFTGQHLLIFTVV